MVQDVKPGGIFMINCQWTDEELDKHMPAASKKYIADNNIQLYTINAIDKAIVIGMGKRTNTILQSAFFKLANIMPIDEAVEYMKAAAKKSYSKKGDAVVEMNYKAIDAGVDAVHKVEVPASWANPEADAPAKELTGRPEVVKMVKDLLEPISIMDGDSLPVSAFKDIADGQFELGASAYEKRGTAVMVPEWDPASCVQCNSCAFVCSHATIRPFILDDVASVLPFVLPLLKAQSRWFLRNLRQNSSQYLITSLLTLVRKISNRYLRMLLQLVPSTISHFSSSPEVVQDVQRHLMLV